MMTAMFRSPVVVYGLDASRKTGEYSVNFGKKALIVTDNNLDKIGLLDGIKRSLTDARVDFVIFDKVRTEPLMEYAEGQPIY